MVINDMSQRLRVAYGHKISVYSGLSVYSLLGSIFVVSSKHRWWYHCKQGILLDNTQSSVFKHDFTTSCQYMENNTHL